MSVLLLRLAGPMQAWGTQSRFSVRDTGLEPSKSGVLGLLCAALGKPRDESVRPPRETPSLAELASLRMAVRIDRPGTMEADYHTAMDVLIAASPPGWEPRLKGCEPSTRYYLADAEFLVALEGETRLLRRLDAALADPVWTLYLGRKSFAPSVPVRIPGGPLQNADLLIAVKSRPWWRRNGREKPGGPLRIVMESDESTGGDVRNDVPLNFISRRRSFSVRRVRDVEMWRVPDELIQEWPPCSCPS